MEYRLGKIEVDARKNASDIIDVLNKINGSIKSLENLLSNDIKKTLPKDSLETSSNNSFNSSSESKCLAKYKKEMQSK